MLRLLVLATLTLVLTAAQPARAERVLTPQARLWVDPDSSTAQVNSPDAERLAAIPSATWLTGSPAASGTATSR